MTLRLWNQCFWEDKYTPLVFSLACALGFLLGTAVVYYLLPQPHMALSVRARIVMEGWVILAIFSQAFNSIVWQAGVTVFFAGKVWNGVSTAMFVTLLYPFCLITINNIQFKIFRLLKCQLQMWVFSLLVVWLIVVRAWGAIILFCPDLPSVHIQIPGNPYKCIAADHKCRADTNFGLAMMVSYWIDLQVLFCVPIFTIVLLDTLVVASRQFKVSRALAFLSFIARL
jgi:hypothetical protein